MAGHSRLHSRLHWNQLVKKPESPPKQKVLVFASILLCERVQGMEV